MCTQQGNTNQGYYLPLATYIGIVSLPSHTGYIVIQGPPLWNHTIRCYDLHLSGAYVYFPTQGGLICLPNTYFSEQ